ncbi:MAG: recombinase family protein [Epulopiscium sp.]|jgi:site-specific DNA recombinase|nr:recombinase family protein [Candidatus Epulonipiscium sp.]
MIYIYARQSIDKKDSISIETQIEYAKREIYGEDFKVYQDKGYSGKNTNRPAFEQMMEDLETEDVSKVVVYRLDRISRSIVDFADFINTLEEKKIAFVSATEKFDTSSPMGKAMLYIIIVFAQLERETIAERVRDNYYARVKKGALGGGPAPYGYDIVRQVVNGTKMSVYKENDDIENVRKIFELYSSPNTSLADVQRYLIEHNIKTTSNKNWDNVKLATLLKSPTYVKADISIYNYYKSKKAIIANEPEEFDGKKACVLVGKRSANTRKYSDVTDHLLAIANHNGIIDSDTFLYCQQKLNENKQIKNLHKGKHSWLTGFVKCGNCGYSFSVRNGVTKDGEIKYFACSGRYLHKACDLKQTHRVADVEEYVEKEILTRVEEKRKYAVAAPQEAKVKTLEYDKKIAEIDVKINNLISSLEDATGASMAYINKRIKELDEEKLALINMHSAEIKANKEKAFLPDFDYYNLSFEDKKYLAKLMIDKVILSDQVIEIVWK